MADEATKTRKFFGEIERKILSGDGIDIGCGDDPVVENVAKFDLKDGDANFITKYVDKKFDYVFSCHCLEHMHNPYEALKEWWEIVKPGGYLIVVVPDEDLYEQGYFPSLFNEDHKATFTISKRESWSPKSHNMLDLYKSLNNAELLKLELQDYKFNRSKLHHAVYSRNVCYNLKKIIRKITNLLEIFKLKKYANNWLCHFSHLPIDQTGGEASAQNFMIIKKSEG
jgi:SAM-dependent methyltransferase